LNGLKKKHSFDYTMDSQAVFRALLDALANPGAPCSIAEQAARFGGGGAWLAMAATLLDNEVTYHWNGAPDAGSEIGYITGSAEADIQSADFILLPATVTPSALLPLVKTGTHTSPHTSGTVIADSSGAMSAECELSGPGVPPEERRTALTEYEREWVTARDALELEYPLGIDLIFLRGDGDIAAITRKAAVKWLT
jgi:alpha-D-ribose 1-methylphosphonate 5-triphosphate synthase subunit PhnH